LNLGLNAIAQPERQATGRKRHTQTGYH